MTNQINETNPLQQTKEQTAASSPETEINEADLENREDFDPDLVLTSADLEAIALADQEGSEFEDLEADEIEEDEFDTDDELGIEGGAFESDDEDDIEDANPTPAPNPDEMDAEEKVRLMATVADAVRAEDIEVLDLRPLTIIADFFLICTGKSSIQLRAIADRIDDRMREAGIRKPRMEGYQEATWILLDYGDVVAHLMAAEQRDFYRLEEFWTAAPRLELKLLPDESNANRPMPTRFETLTPVEDSSKPD